MHTSRLCAISVLALVGCADAPTLDEATSLAGNRKGVDYAWQHASPQALQAGGYTFAARYLSYDPAKNISPAEVAALTAAGVDIVVDWETTADAALGGWSRGAADATEAERQALAAGMPADRPIYFDIDFDASAGDQPTLDAYFDGVASVIGRARTGAYAGYFPIQRLFDGGKIAYGWQTFAWSSGAWDARAQLRQVENSVAIGGGDCDIDVAYADDFGQWGASGPAREAIVAARNANGTLEAFWVGTTGAIQHAWQQAGGWSNAYPLGGAARSLAVAANADGQLELVYVGTDDQLYHRTQVAGGWSDESAVGATASTVAIGRNGDGRLEVVFTALDGSIQHAWQLAPNRGWSEAYGLGGWAKHLAIGTNADGRLEVFYIGSNDQLYHRAQTTGGWTAELAFGVPARDLAIGRNADGRLELFYAAPGGALGHLWQLAPNRDWSDAYALGGAAQQLTVGTNADGRLEIFYTGTNGLLYHRAQITSGWTDELGYGFAGVQPAVERNADGRLEVFYAAPDHALSHTWQEQPNSGWSGGWPLAGTVE